ncbi:hypothetical protein D7Z94_21165 [Ulvibacterium marinum]|uniref:Uncharacterized protein n=1 Tax=Ulvibacterium marinum TaxID=2419782 RepID=A0A3B0C456_9FLAO|nr:hypothetical protein D7Z94_21165 [Ulvibacterium marinum]
MTTNDKVNASREAKALVPELNELFKQGKDSSIMDAMKRLTVKKGKIDKRLRGNLSVWKTKCNVSPIRSQSKIARLLNQIQGIIAFKSSRVFASSIFLS